MIKTVKICINSTKDRFTVDKSGKCSRIISISRKDILFCFSRSIVNDMLVCQPFRKLRKASKCFGEVNKTKIPSTYRRW